MPRTAAMFWAAAVALTWTDCRSHEATLVEQVDALMHDYRGEVPGASVLVVHNGRTVIRRAYGLADLEDHVAATPRPTTVWPP